MIRRYAEGTSVSVDRTRAEIEKLLKANGATAFGFMQELARATLVFEARARHIRFVLPLPDPKAPAFRNVHAFAAEERRRWRCLLLNVKAKFEAVGNNIVTFDEEFLAHIIVPGTSETVGDRATPALKAAYAHGTPMPLLLNARQ